MADLGGHWITLEDGRHIFIADSAGSIPRRAQAGEGATRFSKAHIERALVKHHEETGGKVYTAADEKALNDAAGAGDPFTFHRKLPTEIKEFMAGRPELRKLFKVSGDAGGAGGADAFGELGDRYLDIAEAKAGSPLRAAKETAANSHDPEVKLLAAIHANLPEGKFSGTTINAQGLRVGDEFAIGGSKFRVAEDAQGMRVLQGGSDYPDTEVDALRQLPVDKGSFHRGRKQLLEPAPFSASADDDAGGHWVTVDGHPVLIKGGVVHKGPPHLMGKSVEKGESNKSVDTARQFGLFAVNEKGEHAEIGESAGQANLFNRERYKLAEKPKETKVKPQFDPKHTGLMFSADGAIFALSSDAAKPALMMGWPNEIDGQPVHYRRKEIAQAKHYVNRGKRLEDGSFDEFTIERERMDGWVDSFKRRLANGIKPFVPEKHVKAAADARANMGYLVDLKREDDSLYGTFQLIGDEALAASARNDVSIYVVADAADAEGNRYAEAIEHVCLTPNPVIPHLKPFERIAASADRPAIDAPIFVLAVGDETAPSRERSEMNKELAAKVRAKLGFGADVPDDQLADKLAEKAMALSADVGTLTAERDTLKGKHDALIAASADADTPLPPMVLSLVSSSIKAKRDAVIAAGVVSEAGMKEIEKLYYDNGRPGRAALALSAGSDDPILARLYDILRAHPGVKHDNKVPQGAYPAQQILNLSADGNGDQQALAEKANKDAKEWRDEQLRARGIAVA